jgi:RNA polymerase sigma factor (sigma-70 family)
LSGEGFDTTQWSVVVDATGNDAAAAQAALEQLCRAYRFPLYAFLRREGHPHETAEDLTQQFFETRIVTGQVLRDVRPEGGRFRSWLLRCLKNMVINERKREHTLKRGGRERHVSLDLEDADERYAKEIAPGASADQSFDRSWALTLLDRAYGRVEEGYEKRQDSATFDALKGFLPGAREKPSYTDAAARLGREEAAVRKAVSRLRGNFGEAVRAEIGAPLGVEEDVDGELRYLLSLLTDEPP